MLALRAFIVGLGLVAQPVVAQDISAGEDEAIAEGVPGFQLDDPTTGMIGQVNAWLYYSSDFGLTGGASGTFKFPAGDGQSLSLGGEVAEQRQSASLAYHHDQIFDSAAALDLTLRGAHDKARAILPFETSTVGLEGKLTWQLNDQAKLSAYVGHAANRIYNPAPDLSVILQPDVGRTNRSYLGAEYTRGVALSSPGLARLRYTVSAEAAHVDSGETQLRARVGLLTGGALGEGAVAWRADLRAGALGTANGESSIGERFILGAASLRGFGYGGFGPHDGEQTLGGNKFAVARLDVMFPKAFGSGTRLVPGVHADFGSLWGLDNTGGGLVDDSMQLRGSVGVTLSMQFDRGSLNLSVSEAFAKEETDESQTFQLNFYSKF